MALTGSEELYRSLYRGNPDIVRQMELATNRTGNIIQDMTKSAGQDIRARGSLLGQGIGDAALGGARGFADLRDWKDRKRREGLSEESMKMSNEAQKLDLDAKRAEEAFMNEGGASGLSPTGNLPAWGTPSLGMSPGGSRRQQLLQGQFAQNMGEYGMGDYRRGQEKKKDSLAEEATRAQIAATKASSGLAGAQYNLQAKQLAEQQALQSFMIAKSKNNPALLEQTKLAFAKSMSPQDIARLEGTADLQIAQQQKDAAGARRLIMPEGQALNTSVADTRARLKALDEAIGGARAYTTNAGNEYIPGDIPSAAQGGLAQFTHALQNYHPNAGNVGSMEFSLKGGLNPSSAQMRTILDDTIGQIEGNLGRMKAEARMVDGNSVGAATQEVMLLEQQLQGLKTQRQSLGGSDQRNNVNLFNAKKQGNSALFQGGGAAATPAGAPAAGAAPQLPGGAPPQASVAPSFRHLAASPLRHDWRTG